MADARFRDEHLADNYAKDAPPHAQPHAHENGGQGTGDQYLQEYIHPRGAKGPRRRQQPMVRAAHARHGVDHDGEDRAQKDYGHLRSQADAEPHDQDGQQDDARRRVERHQRWFDEQPATTRNPEIQP